MWVRFFIERPIFATVCSLLIVIAGAASIPGLPVSQYPDLAPPQVVVTAVYTGASSEVVERTVTTVLEQQINGTDGMAYMTSLSTNSGGSQITVTFDVSRDPDLAAVDVQNRVSQATARLPNEVKLTGVTVTKASTAFVLAMAVYDPSGAYDPIFISNYVDVYLSDTLKRVHGVGDVRIFGERRYSMRLWLDPARLASRRLTASDVVNALGEQNVQVAAGQLGSPPAPPGQTYQMSLRAAGRLTDPKEFERLVLKTTSDGTLIHLGDVGRAELGAEDYSNSLRFNGKPAVGIGILQLPMANALDVGREVKARMAVLARSFPPGLKYEIGFDTTAFVQDSIREVVKTLAEAIALVILTMFLFLASVRATIIPAITIPVSLIGTFAFVRLFGFSINTLTLFGLVLATGLVVDDAIVVIENVQRVMHEKGLSRRDAASTAMGEVTGAVIATSLVLIAVFVPVAFFPGTTGRIYKQFSLTIAFSVAISAWSALTLTPAIAAMLLRPRSAGRFAARVERITDWARDGYGRLLSGTLHHGVIMSLVLLVSLGLTYVLYRTVPTGFVPDEDRGYFIVSVQGPDGSSLEQTEHAIARAEAVAHEQAEVQNTLAIPGFSLGGAGSNKGVMFVSLEPYADRKGSAHSAQAVIGRIRGRLFGIPEALVLPFSPPAIQGIGTYGGFQFVVLDQGRSTPEEIAAATGALVRRGNADHTLRGLFTSFTANDPQIAISIDRDKAKTLHLRLDEIFKTLSVFIGSDYVNDFDYANRAYRVYVQAEGKERTLPRQLEELYARADTGEMVPLGAVVHMQSGVSPQIISHYNLFRSAEIDGAPAPGFSTGQAIERMQQLAREVLPGGMSYTWTGISLEEVSAGGTAKVLFAFGLLIVLLVLAAQYESFSLPLVVLLGVPIAILGALSALLVRSLHNDVFSEVGLLMLVGLASKNAILIVEFARRLREEGLSIVDAVIQAAKTRLRPILMTSFAFILGVLPLVFATGAGSASRHSLGTTVFGGMIVSTLLNLLIIPTLYVLVETGRERLQRQRSR